MCHALMCTIIWLTCYLWKCKNDYSLVFFSLVGWLQTCTKVCHIYPGAERWAFKTSKWTHISKGERSKEAFTLLEVRANQLIDEMGQQKNINCNHLDQLSRDFGKLLHLAVAVADYNQPFSLQVCYFGFVLNVFDSLYINIHLLFVYLLSLQELITSF